MKKRILAMLVAGTLLTGGMTATVAGAAHSGKMTMSTVTLHSLAGSGVTGTAVFTYNSATKTTTVKLTVKHLKAMSVHPAHVHTGRCGANGAPGGVVEAFPLLHAGNNGIAVAKITFPGTFTHKMWAVNVHTGPGLAPASQYKVIACGNVM